MRLIWFSQNISTGRGLEFILDSWPALSSFCELTLIGRQHESIKERLASIEPSITILDAMDQKKLHATLSQFDIGLALELSAADLNKQLALSNKLIAYAQAGLFVLATDTPAQVDFIKQYSFVGEVVQQNSDKVLIVLKICLNDCHRYDAIALSGMRWLNNSVGMWNQIKSNKPGQQL
jgi:hypothetical protein